MRSGCDCDMMWCDVQTNLYYDDDIVISLADGNECMMLCHRLILCRCDVCDDSTVMCVM